MYDSEVAFVYQTVLEELFEHAKGFCGAGDDEETACVAIEAMNDAGAHRFADSCYFRIVREYPLHNRAGFSGARRVYLYAGGLVDNDMRRRFRDDSDGNVWFGAEDFFCVCEGAGNYQKRCVSKKFDVRSDRLGFEEYAAFLYAARDVCAAEFLSDNVLEIF